jgi:plastocyanin
MKPHRWLALGLVAVGVLGAAACSVWGPEGGPGGAGMAPATSTVDSAAATLGSDGVQRVDIVLGDDLRLHPSLVQAHPGVLEITFHNNGSTPHDMNVQAGATATTGNLNGGQSSTVRITLDQVGRYAMPCVYHVSSGMTGTIEVL